MSVRKYEKYINVQKQLQGHYKIYNSWNSGLGEEEWVPKGVAARLFHINNNHRFHSTCMPHTVVFLSTNL
jgi:hypothetical protein